MTAAGPATSRGGGRPADDRAATLARLAEQVQAISARPAGSPPTADTSPSTTAEPLPDGGQAALAWLVRSTSQRPLTMAEARAKLLGRGHDEAVVDAVVARALETGLLDDRAFASAWVQDRGVTRGYGRARLRRELRGRQVPDDLVEGALTSLDDVDEVAQATALARARAQRMPAHLDPVKVAARLVGFLQRRGFDSGVAHRVARQVTALDRDWD